MVNPSMGGTYCIMMYVLSQQLQELNEKDLNGKSYIEFDAGMCCFVKV